MSESEIKVFDWDAEISNDGEGNFEENVILPDGIYPFEVIKTEKTWHNPSAKLPGCNECDVYLRVDGGELGKSLVVERLYLCERTEWKISAFLRAIGLKKHGETINVGQLLHCDGETGRCQIEINNYPGKNGEKKSNNKLVRFFDKEGTAEAKPAAKKWAKGSF